jgi:hypothetical protein
MYRAFHNVLRDYKEEGNQRTYLNGIVHRHRKTDFFKLEVFDVCTTGDTTHIDTVFKLSSAVRLMGNHLISVCPDRQFR